MGSGPIRGSSKSKERQAASLPPWVTNVERTSGQSGSEPEPPTSAPEESTAPSRTPIVRINEPRKMADKDSSVFQNASNIFVVFGASVSLCVKIGSRFDG